MKKNKIKSVEEALQLFEDYTIKRGIASDADDYKTYNKLLPIVYNSIVYLFDNQQLNLLFKFLKHNNHYVRSFAAYALLPLFENECVEVLQEIANGNYGLQSLNAETTLMMWRDGELKFPYQTDSVKKPAPKKEENSSIKVCSTNVTMNKENFPIEIFRLSQIFECPPTNDTELRNEQSGFYVMLNSAKQELMICINTFVNPYTQDVERVYQERLERFKAFEHIATISADKPSKLGFMQIRLAIPEDKATDDMLTQIKDIIYLVYNEWKPNECKVCFQTNYRGDTCYFEGSWWYPARAVIKDGYGYVRYDFSDELKYDEEMWEIVQGEYDEFENSDTFTLMTPIEFQNIWKTTERSHKANR